MTELSECLGTIWESGFTTQACSVNGFMNVPHMDLYLEHWQGHHTVYHMHSFLPAVLCFTQVFCMCFFSRGSRSGLHKVVDVQDSLQTPIRSEEMQP